MRQNAPQRTHISTFFLGGMPPPPPKMGHYAATSALPTLFEPPFSNPRSTTVIHTLLLTCENDKIYIVSSTHILFTLSISAPPDSLPPILVSLSFASLPLLLPSFPPPPLSPPVLPSSLTLSLSLPLWRIC